MKRIITLIGFAICMQSLLQGQFQAKMINHLSGTERIYKVYSDLNKYRYEFEEDGEAGIVIVDPIENSTAILVPGKKYVHLTTCDGMMSRMNDPVQSYETNKKYGPEKIAGNETIQGYQCIIKDLYQGDTKVFTSWYSEQLNFPLKIVAHFSDDSYMEIKEISKWKPDNDLFLIPIGYTEVDERMRPIIPEPEPPETWETMDVHMPYEGTLKRGEIIRMTIPETVYYKLVAVNNGKTPAKYTYHLYADGEKLPWDVVGNDSRRTKRLFMEEKSTNTFDWKAGWELVVEVYEGVLDLRIYPE